MRWAELNQFCYSIKDQKSPKQTFLFLQHKYNPCSLVNAIKGSLNKCLLSFCCCWCCWRCCCSCCCLSHRKGTGRNKRFPNLHPERERENEFFVLYLSGNCGSSAPFSGVWSGRYGSGVPYRIGHRAVTVLRCENHPPSFPSEFSFHKFFFVRRKIHPRIKFLKRGKICRIIIFSCRCCCCYCCCCCIHVVVVVTTVAVVVALFFLSALFKLRILVNAGVFIIIVFNDNLLEVRSIICIHRERATESN